MLCRQIFDKITRCPNIIKYYLNRKAFNADKTGLNGFSAQPKKPLVKIFPCFKPPLES